MHTSSRPTRRDWLAALAAGATLGLVILGVGGRIGMRFMALSAGQAPAFSIEGSIAVSLLGAASGAIIATIFMGLRAALPTRRWIRGAIFWTICLGLALRGIKPVTLLKAEIFLPLFLLHGSLLHMYWCRFYLTRRAAHTANVTPTSGT